MISVPPTIPRVLGLSFPSASSPQELGAKSSCAHFLFLRINFLIPTSSFKSFHLFPFSWTRSALCSLLGVGYVTQVSGTWLQGCWSLLCPWITWIPPGLGRVANCSILQQKQWHTGMCLACLWFDVAFFQLCLAHTLFQLIAQPPCEMKNGIQILVSYKTLTCFYSELHLGTTFYPEALRNFFPSFILIY